VYAPSVTSPDPRSGWAFLGLCAVASTWIDFGSAHLLTSDALIPILVSLQRWTPFYWGQNRYGMLVPLIALPIRAPFANLLVQVGLTMFAGLASIFLVCWYLIRNPIWPVVATVASALFVCCAPRHVCVEYLATTQPYGVSFGLGIGGLLVARSLNERFHPAKVAVAAARLKSVTAWPPSGTSDR
jgi:hypothetical protein